MNRTDRVKIEPALVDLPGAEKESEPQEALRKYYDLYDQAPSGYCIIACSGEIREINRAGAALLGLDQSGPASRNITACMAGEASPALAHFLKRLCSADAKVTGEMRVGGREPGGGRAERTILLEGRSFLSPVGERLGRVVMVDTTEFRRLGSEREHYHCQLEELVRQRTRQLEAANIRLRDQAENLSSIYQALDSIGLIVCRLEKEDARIEIFSAGAARLFGYRQEEAVGQSIALIYPAESLPILADRVKRLRLGQVMQSFDMTLQRKSGEIFPVVVSIHPFARQGSEFSKAVGVFRDISALMRTQDQLQATNDELERRVEQRTQELQQSQRQFLHAEKLTAIGTLSASIAQEFNNPMQSILSILKGLGKRAILEEEDRQLLAAAIGEGKRIKALIRSLQEFHRPTSGRKVVMDVHAALDSVLLLHRSDFNAKRISVTLDYAEWLPQIMAVPDQIKQVLLNLLANAAVACRSVGGEIRVATRQVDGAQVAVEIRDNGIGIQPEEMELIFQPFYTTKMAARGTGLGLSVSSGIIRQHGGALRVDSRPGEGATFTVLLPIGGDGVEGGSG